VTAAKRAVFEARQSLAGGEPHRAAGVLMNREFGLLILAGAQEAEVLVELEDT